jgi:nucleoside-diphosphate-sugar epimerase
MAELTLVTGAAGWLGTGLLRRLAAEERPVRALVERAGDAAAVAAASALVDVEVGDVTQPADVARFLRGAEGAELVHAAGVIHPRRVADFARVNAGGTRAVLDAARRAGVRRLVHVSSNSPFGLNPTTEDRFRAEEPFRPYLGYGRSKMEGEVAVREAHGDGIETVVVRPPWFYGPHQPPRQSRFFTAVRRGRFPLVGRGDNRRSMGYVPALADGIVRALRTPAAGGRAYWLADARPYPMTEVVDTVRAALRAEGYEVADRRPPHLPAAAGALAARADALLQSRGAYVAELHVLGELGATIACDVSAAERDLGWTAPTSLLDGMRASIRWCRDAGIAL